MSPKTIPSAAKPVVAKLLVGATKERASGGVCGLASVIGSGPVWAQSIQLQRQHDKLAMDEVKPIPDLRRSLQRSNVVDTALRLSP
jgi:hypothetical protein